MYKHYVYDIKLESTVLAYTIPVYLSAIKIIELRDQLVKSLNYFVPDFNTIGPNGQLQGLTPDEAYQGMQMPDNFRTNILKQARLDRLAHNRENHCKICK
jgi:hypothetical protein